jgi:iron(III) transport system permease protein
LIKNSSLSTRVNRGSTALVIALLAAVVLINLILPMLALLTKSVDFEPFYEGFRSTLRSNATIKALFNSVWISLTASFIAVASAFFFAYIVEYKLTDRLRKIYRFLSILPMLVPSITHGIVIIYLFGRRGIFTRLFGFQLPIYGPLGVIMGSFFYAFPIAFLVLSQGFANLDGRLYENAIILGVRPLRRMVEIVFPVMKYAVFSAYSVCFTMIFTDYGIPLSVGGTYAILPILFYKNVVGMLNFSRGAVYSAMILVPAIIVYLLDIFYFSKRQVSSRHNIIPVNSGPFHILQKVAFGFMTLCIVTPIVLIIIAPFVQAWPYDLTLTVSHFARIIRVGRLGQLVTNSVTIALLTGLFGTILAFVAGYMYIRNQDGFFAAKRFTHGLYMISLAIPGLALGLGFALFFRGTPIYGTMAIMITVNVMHFFGSPYMMVLSHFKLLNPNLESICYTLGGNRLHVLKDVILPNSYKMLLDVFVYFFTNTMITISAVSLLYSHKTMTLALQITAYNDQGTWESAVAISLVILGINMGMRLLQNLRLERHHARNGSANLIDA